MKSQVNYTGDEDSNNNNKWHYAMAEIIDAALATAGKPCDLGDELSKYLEKL